MLCPNIFILSFMVSHGAVCSPREPVPVSGSSVHASVVDSVPASDLSVLLTADLMKRMTTFWRHFQQEPDSIREAGQNNHQEEFGLFSVATNQAGDRWVKKSVVDIHALVTQYPSVAADLAQAGLTANQWNRARKALYKAIILDGMAFTKEVETKDTSNVGKNIVFLASHTKELDDLRATGMWLPNPGQVESGVKQLIIQIGRQHPEDVILP